MKHLLNNQNKKYNNINKMCIVINRCIQRGAFTKTLYYYNMDIQLPFTGVRGLTERSRRGVRGNPLEHSRFK